MNAVVIVGAGPAGIRAAQTLVAHGVCPVLLDEAARGGGQIYRRQPVNFKRSPVKLYGFEARKASALHQTIDALREQLDYRPDTLVWNAEDGALDTLHEGRAARVEFPRRPEIVGERNARVGDQRIGQEPGLPRVDLLAGHSRNARRDQPLGWGH